MGRPSAPGIDFGAPKTSIFKLFRRSCACNVNIVRSVQNTGRSYDFHTSEVPCDKTKTLKIAPRARVDCLRCCESAWTELWAGPEASRDRPRDALGRLPGSLGAPGRPKIGLGASYGRPGPVPSTSRHVPETVLSNPNHLQANLHGFSLIFGRFHLDFRTNLHRFGARLPTGSVAFVNEV